MLGIIKMEEGLKAEGEKLVQGQPGFRKGAGVERGGKEGIVEVTYVC